MKLYLHSLNVNSKDVIRISEIEVIEISGIPINEILYGWRQWLMISKEPNVDLFISKLSSDNNKKICMLDPLVGIFFTLDPILRKEQIKSLKIEIKYEFMENLITKPKRAKNL